MTHASRIPELLATHRALTDAPEIWLDVSQGLVSPEEAARAMTGRESPALIERSKALFAPPSAEQERAMRERLLAEVAPPRRRFAWAVAGGLALAAGIVLAVALRAPPQQAAAPLGATYQVELSAGWEGVRGTTPGEPEPGAVPTFRSDQRVSFTLRPSVALDEPELEVVMLAYDEAGRGHRLGPARRLPTRTGTVSFTEELASLGLGAGTWRLVLVVGRPGRTPEDPLRFDPTGEDTDEGDHAVTRTEIHVLDNLGQ